jgi:aspartyl-tRNA(Asn)/glutamyl-tRNA(Gln) amidotransferase subunit A
MLAAYDRSVDQLASLGAEIVDIALPGPLAEAAAANGRIISAEAYAALADLVDDPGQPLDEAARRRVRAGAAISSRAYSWIWRSGSGPRLRSRKPCAISTPC